MLHSSMSDPATQLPEIGAVETRELLDSLDRWVAEHLEQPLLLMLDGSER